jgi:hypothetical protein
LPTHFETETFAHEFGNLSKEQKSAFLTVLVRFIEDLVAKEADAGSTFRASLRVKPYRSSEPGVLEMTWDGDGRALFQFGTSPVSGMLHIEWLRVGTHEIF